MTSVPVLADDEFGGDLFACGCPAVDALVIQVQISDGVMDGWGLEALSGGDLCCGKLVESRWGWEIQRVGLRRLCDGRCRLLGC